MSSHSREEQGRIKRTQSLVGWGSDLRDSQDTYRRLWLRAVRVYPPSTASPARSNHRGLVGLFFIETNTLLGFLWYFSSLLMCFLFFFFSQWEGRPWFFQTQPPTMWPHSTPATHPAPEGFPGPGAEDHGEAPWRSLCTHTPDKMGW